MVISMSVTMMWMVYIAIIYVMLTTPDMFIFWVLMELQNLLILNLMCKKESSESAIFKAMMFYFVIQSSAGLMFLLSVSEMMSFMSNMSSFMMVSSIIIKLAMFPFHIWFFEMSPFFSPLMLSVMITTQKLPLILLMSLNMNSLLWVLLIVNNLIGAIFMIKSMNISHLMVSSSIYSTLWLVVLCTQNLNMMIIFLSLYFVTTLMLIMKWKESGTLSIVMSLLFLVGLPPMSMFILKIYTMEIMSKIFSAEMMIIMSVTTFLSLLAYMKVFTKLSSYETTLYYKMNFPKKMDVLIMMMVSIFLMFTI